MISERRYKLLLLCLLCAAGILWARFFVRFSALSVPEPTPTPTAVTACPTPTPSPTPSPTPTPRPAPALIETRIPAEYFAPTDKAGEISYVEYTTHDYVDDPSAVVTKRMAVYTPYGYDSAAQYDVVFLFHVKGCDESFWLHNALGYEVNGQYTAAQAFTLLDNMIAHGMSSPVIVFAPDLYLNDTVRRTHDQKYTYPQFRREFGEDILPFVVENYATYAEGTDRAALSAAREHFGVIGASFGAYMGYLGIMQDNYDLVANYGLTGAGQVDWGEIESIWGPDLAARMPMRCLYFGSGENESYGEPQASYLALQKRSDVFSDNNLFFNLFPEYGHESRTWLNTLFNSLQVFFR